MKGNVMTKQYETVITEIGDDGQRTERAKVVRNLTGGQFDHLKGCVDRADQVVPTHAETTSGEFASLDMPDAKPVTTTKSK